jgi:hypothetical protein
VLVKEGFVSEREVLDHRTAYDVAKLQRTSPRPWLDTAVEMVRRTIIRAPHDGQISDCTVLVGQIVIGAQSINNGTPLDDGLRHLLAGAVDVNLNEFAATRVESRQGRPRRRSTRSSGCARPARSPSRRPSAPRT